MLVVFGGLPGVGKTSIARAVATLLGATHLYVDTIEQALRDSGFDSIDEQGYVIAYRLTYDNLRTGQTVIADAVNAHEMAREQWRHAAAPRR